MAIDYQLKDADRVLDELELAARSEIPNATFFDQLLSSLKELTLAESSSVVLHLKSSGWVLLAQAGKGVLSFLDDMVRFAEKSSGEAFLTGEANEKSWLAVPIRRGRLEDGCLVIAFDSRIPASGLNSLSAIATAFAEVLAIRQMCRWESLLENRWASIQALSDKLSQLNSIDRMSELVANRLVSEFSAVRVSMVEGPNRKGKRPRMLATSGVPNLDRRSQILKNLERIALEVVQIGKPVFRLDAVSSSDSLTSMDRGPLLEDGTFKNLLAISTVDSSVRNESKGSVIILEWADRETMMEAMPAITHFIPTLCSAWQQQQRWLKVPRLARAWSRLAPNVLLSMIFYRAIQLLAVVTLVGTVFWFLSRPYPMTIEADAVLDPKRRRAIFSNVDGFVDDLLVEDGQTVEQGQLLAKLRSPALRLQIEEVMGQIKSISEKRNGLRVAVNQVSASSPETLVAQTRISAEILLLEAQEKQTRNKLDFLTKEQEKLNILSPIRGLVVSRDLRRELETRPLRRGDILFQVADLDGEWQLNVQIADRDSNYLKKHLAEGDREATFVFDSLPREQFRTKVKQVSATIENPTGTSPFLLVVADIESEVAKRAYMGANAHVRLTCGEQPFWFVWCRPLVEALQKRAWLPTDISNNESHDDAIAE